MVKNGGEEEGGEEDDEEGGEEAREEGGEEEVIPLSARKPSPLMEDEDRERSVLTGVGTGPLFFGRTAESPRSGRSAEGR